MTATKKDPLAEGIIPLTKDGRKSWASLGDDELVNYARAYIKENRIKGRRALQMAEGGLYDALKDRGLLGRAGLPQRRRNFSGMSDEELLCCAVAFIQKESIGMRVEFQKKDAPLYMAIFKRGLVDRIGLRPQRKDWESIGDKELLGLAYDISEKERIGGIHEFKKRHNGLYEAIRRRGLLGKTGIKRRTLRWSAMGDDELIRFVRDHMEREGISGKKELYRSDSRLFQALQRRGLVEKVGFVPRTRSWAQMSDRQLIRHARNLMEERGITRRSVFEREDGGLYHALLSRGLMDDVGFTDPPVLTRLDDGELTSYARSIIRRDGIDSISDLAESQHALYEALRVRDLLGRIGLGYKKRMWKEISDEDLIRMAKAQMASMEKKTRGALKQADPGFYDALRTRGLLCRIGFELVRKKKRFFSSMPDQEIIAEARAFMEEKGIETRSGLKEAYASLYGLLGQRRLLGKVFGKADASKKKQAIREVVDGLEGFARTANRKTAIIDVLESLEEF